MTDSAKTAFVTVAERREQEKQSARYTLASAEFLKAAHETLYDRFHPRRRGVFTHARMDVPYIDESMSAAAQRVFDVLKGEYPQLNHFRIRSEGIIFDTKPNTAWRRFRVGDGLDAGGGP